MKVKTFILTFLMMMSSPFLFGQHWTDPGDLGYQNSMTVLAEIVLDNNVQTGNYQVAAFHGNQLLEVSEIIPFQGTTSNHHVHLLIQGDNSMSNIYFKFFNGTKVYVSETCYSFSANQTIGDHPNYSTINFKSVAQIEGTEYDVVYPTLQAAIDVVANEETITLLADNAENVTVVQAADKAFTIDGAEKYYTGTITVNGKSAAYATAGLTIKNVNFDANNITKDASINLGGNNNIRYTSNVTVEDCTFVGNIENEKVAIKNYTGGCKNLTVTGCEAEGLHSLVQVRGVAGLTIDDVTVKDCKNGIAVGTSTDVVVKNSEIAATGYGVRADGEGAYNMTMSDNTITAELPVVVRKAKGAYNLTVESGVFTATNEKDAAVTFTNGDDGTFEVPTGNATATLADGISQFGFEAKIGNVYYTTFEEAYAKATAEQGVTVCADITGEGFKINKDITIDFGGYTYTINKAVGSTGTESQGFQLLKGNTVILKNGTIAVAEGTNVKWMFNAYANLTLEGINVNCTNMAAPAEGEKNYVLVVNNGGGATPTVNYNNVTIEGFEGTPIWLDPTTTLVAGEGLENTIEVEEGYAVVYNNGKYTAIAANVQVKDGETVKGTYATIADAITAANAGNTIVLLKDITENVTINKSVTLDGANFKYTGTMTGNAGITATVKNVNFVNGGFVKSTKGTTGTYSFLNCTFDGNKSYTYPFKIVGANKVTVENCTVKDYQYSFLYVTSSTNTVNVKNVTVEDCPSYAIYFASGVSSNSIENLTVKNSDNGIIYNNTANRTLNLKDCTFENVTTAVNGADTNATKTITCNLDGVNEIGGATFSQYVKIVADAQIGTKIYGNLQDAITAAEVTEENETIKVVADFTTEKSYTVKGTVTLDLNGKTIAGTDNATVSFGLINTNAGADLTINDSSEDESGKITLTATNNRGWNYYSSVISNQRAKLTVNGGTIKHLGGTDMAYAIDNLTNTGAQKAETVINDGNIISEYRAIRQFANSASGENILTINGGNVSYIWMQSANDKANLATTTVEGGNVEQIRISGSNAILDLKVKASCLGEAGVWGTMPTGKVLKEVEGYYTLVDAIAKIVAADNTTTYYASIQEAIDAATEGQTVTVCADVELESTITVAADKVVTLDLNGKVVAYTSYVQGETMITNKGNLTITDNTEANEGKIAYIYTGAADTNYGKGNYTFTNQGVLSIQEVEVTVEAKDHIGKFPHALYVIQNANTLTVDNAQIINNNNVAIRQWATTSNDNVITVKGENAEVKGVRAIWIQLPSNAPAQAPVVKLNVENGTLAAIGEGEGDNRFELAIYSYSYGQDMKNVEINISGGTFNGDIALTGGSNRENIESLNITGGTFNGLYGEVYSYGDDAKAIEAISITGGTFSTNKAEKYAEDDNFIFVQNAEGTYTVTEGAYVAEVGGVRYASVTKAITAAQAGNTITLLRDVEETVTINKNLTLDGAGKNYTGTMNISKDKTVTVQNVKFVKGCIDKAKGSSGTLTVKNCDFNGVDKSINYAVTMRGGSTVTIEGGNVKNYGYGMLYVPSAVTNVNVKDTEVDGVNYGVHVAYGSKVNIESVTMTNMTYGIMTQNYGAKTITIKNSNISGTNPIYVWERNTTVVDTFKFLGANTFSGLTSSAQAKLVLAAADATLTAPENYKVTTTVEGSEVEYENGVYFVQQVLKGEGTEESPFLISNLDELILFRNHVNAGKTDYNAEGVHVALAADIDMAEIDWSENIGDDCNYTFDGIFDGKGHKIYNLNSVETSQKDNYFVCTGLFGAIYGNAVVKNLTIENVNINTDEFTGNCAAAVVGFVYGASGKTVTIENVKVTGNININASGIYGVGAIVGYSYNQGISNISNCTVEANDESVIAAASGSGAIIGYCGGIATIKDCNVENIDITAKGLVGGIAGITENSANKVLSNNTVNNVTLTATKAEWINSTAIAVGTMAGNGLTVSGTTYENVNVDRMVGSVYAEEPTSVVPAVEARIGDKYYSTLQTAINAAVDEDEIVVLTDIEVNIDNVEGLPTVDVYPTYYEVTGKTISIDLNGKTIKANVTTTTMLLGLFSTEENGNLTFTDSSNGNGTVEVVASDDANVYALITNYEPTSAITINGGNYKLNKTGKNGQSLIYDSPGKMIINGGNFYIGNIGTGTNGMPWIFNTYQANANSVTVNGGTFNADINHQFWANEVYVPETLALEDNGNGTWTVVEAVAYVEETATSTGASARNVGYATIEEAISAINNKHQYTESNNGTVTMLKDVELENTITIAAGEEVVLDLNGKVVSQEKECTTSYSMFENNGKLTITGEGTINFKDLSNGGGSSWGTYIITNKGELIVENGTLEHLGTADANFDTNLPIQNYAGKVTVNGGTIKSTQFRSLRDFTAGGEIVINGGTFVGQVWMQGLGNGSSSLTINGGNFEPQANDGSSVFITNGTNVVNVSITDGYFATKIGATYAEKEGVAGCITGGTFTDAAKENTNAALVSEGFAFTANEDGTWTVMPVQKQHLVKGWNWFSSYLNIEGTTGFEKLTTAMGTNGLEIKSQDDGFVDYSEYGWYGTLNSIDLSKMYMIKTSEACELNMSASVVNPADHTISLKGTGWTWIGYPSNVGVDINVAFANLQPTDGDMIKTQYNGIADYAYGQWWGTLNTMVPGIGYQYKNAAGETREFVYNIEGAKASTKANITSDNNHWTPDATLYPNTMTMTAVVDGVMNGEFEVAAFVNGEVRGSARPIYVEPMDAYMLFLTIHGDEVEEMTFMYHDLTTGETSMLNDRFNYSNDAHLGSVKEPYVFSRGTTGIGEASLSEFNIYPNPTTIGTEINLEATCDTVEVFNALGVKIAEYQNVDSLDAFETAGIYVIRLTNNGDVKHCRVVVK